MQIEKKCRLKLHLLQAESCGMGFDDQMNEKDADPSTDGVLDDIFSQFAKILYRIFSGNVSVKNVSAV